MSVEACKWEGGSDDLPIVFIIAVPDLARLLALHYSIAQAIHQTADDRRDANNQCFLCAGVTPADRFRAPMFELALFMSENGTRPVWLTECPPPHHTYLCGVSLAYDKIK